MTASRTPIARLIVWTRRMAHSTKLARVYRRVAGQLILLLERRSPRGALHLPQQARNRRVVRIIDADPSAKGRHLWKLAVQGPAWGQRELVVGYASFAQLADQVGRFGRGLDDDGQARRTVTPEEARQLRDSAPAREQHFIGRCDVLDRLARERDSSGDSTIPSRL